MLVLVLVLEGRCLLEGQEQAPEDNKGMDKVNRNLRN
jgi:hypothetical protein